MPAAEEEKSAKWDKVKQWFEKFEEYVERTDLITPGELQKLPVGLRTTIGNTHYDLLVTQAIFGPETTELAVYLRVSGPDWQGEDRSLYFGADKILISSQGGFIGDAKLALMGDIALTAKGDMFKLRFLGKKEDGEHTNTDDGLPPSYAIVSCEGFKELQLSAVLELNSDKIGLVENGKVTDQPVKTSFFCTAEALDDIVVKVDLPEFGLKHVPDWTFAAEDVMLDFSQTSNAPGFKGYSVAGSNSGSIDFSEIWQGLYIGKIRLQFPDYIKKVDGAKPSVLADKMWIDEKGLTGAIGAEDVLMLTEGSLGGWGFSIEDFSMEFLHDQIKGGSMVTASQAFSYGRELYAVPGRIGDRLSEGCNYLIAADMAGCISGTGLFRITPATAQLPYETPVDEAAPRQHPSPGSPDDEAGRLLHAMQGHGPSDTESLRLATGIPYGRLTALLSEMEIDGKIWMEDGYNWRIKIK